jgi:hypothetical protein
MRADWIKSLAVAAALVPGIVFGCSPIPLRSVSSDVIADGWIRVLEASVERTDDGAESHRGVAVFEPLRIHQNAGGHRAPFRFSFHFYNDHQGCLGGVLPFDTPEDRPVRIYLRPHDAEANPEHTDFEVLSIDDLEPPKP